MPNIKCHVPQNFAVGRHHTWMTATEGLDCNFATATSSVTCVLQEIHLQKDNWYAFSVGSIDEIYYWGLCPSQKAASYRTYTVFRSSESSSKFLLFQVWAEQIHYLHRAWEARPDILDFLVTFPPWQARTKHLQPRQSVYVNMSSFDPWSITHMKHRYQTKDLEVLEDSELI